MLCCFNKHKIKNVSSFKNNIVNKKNIDLHDLLWYFKHGIRKRNEILSNKLYEVVVKIILNTKSLNLLVARTYFIKKIFWYMIKSLYFLDLAQLICLQITYSTTDFNKKYSYSLMISETKQVLSLWFEMKHKLNN